MRSLPCAISAQSPRLTIDRLEIKHTQAMPGLLQAKLPFHSQSIVGLHHTHLKLVGYEAAREDYFP